MEEIIKECKFFEVTSKQGSKQFLATKRKIPVDINFYKNWVVLKGFAKEPVDNEEDIDEVFIERQNGDYFVFQVRDARIFKPSNDSNFYVIHMIYTDSTFLTGEEEKSNYKKELTKDLM